ncbi:MAG: 3-deoxy-manno-octulosonate cytidylyltransferase [Clostridia bacterium]|nr:3-deoxy-manno-octulosonate cytidylyltransferase [Clostridia bacterium]
MKNICVIPSRYKSTRFEGKPLMDICGHPMVWWVYQEAKKIKEFDKVVVATEDNRVKDACDAMNIECIITSDKHPTGTDRVCEVAKYYDAEYYYVLMGDEPLLTEKEIYTMVEALEADPAPAALLATKFKNAVDVVNSSTIKLAMSNDSDLIYMSRSPLPYPKGALDFDYYKNVGLYVFSKDCLEKFENLPIGRMERIEELEMLRILENHIRCKAVVVDTDAMSVDTYKDLNRIRSIMSKRIG